MITKKVSAEMESNLLRLIYERYVERYGRGVRNLDSFPILVTSGDLYSLYMPELTVKDGNATRYLFIDVVKELVISGDLRFDNQHSYFLTEAGYKRASMGFWEKSLDFANENAGLAIPISILSFFVSAVALFVGK